MSKKGKLQSFNDKGISKFTSLQEALSATDGEDESICTVTVLPPESSNRDIPTDEEDNFEDNASFPSELAGGELDVNYNLNIEAKSENEIDGPTSSNKDRKRTTTRNTTKNTATSPGTMNEASECDSDDEDYMAHLPKRKPKTGATKKTKMKTLRGQAKEDDEGAKKNKWKSNATLFVPLEKMDSINFHPKIERIEGMTPYETCSCLFIDATFDNPVEQTQLYATRDKGNHNFNLTRSDIYQFTGILLFSGYHKVPKERDYWSSQIDLHVSFIANAMTRNRYLQIKQYLHVADNRNLVEGSKVAKIKSLYDALNLALKNLSIITYHDKLSINESMVPYKGLHSIRQYMKSKPIKFGYKIWSLCSNNGLPY